MKTQRNKRRKTQRVTKATKYSSGERGSRAAQNAAARLKPRTHCNSQFLSHAFLLNPKCGTIISSSHNIVHHIRIRRHKCTSVIAERCFRVQRVGSQALGQECGSLVQDEVGRRRPILSMVAHRRNGLRGRI